MRGERTLYRLHVAGHGRDAGGQNPMTKDLYFGLSEYWFVQVDREPVLPEPGENLARHKNVVMVDEEEGQAQQHTVHEEFLRGKRHTEKLKRLKDMMTAVLGMSSGDMVVALDKIQGGEDMRASNIHAECF